MSDCCLTPSSVTHRWFRYVTPSPSPVGQIAPVSSTNKTDCHDITEILSFCLTRGCISFSCLFFYQIVSPTLRSKSLVCIPFLLCLTMNVVVLKFLLLFLQVWTQKCAGCQYFILLTLKKNSWTDWHRGPGFFLIKN